MNSSIFGELITSFNKAEEAFNEGSLWTSDAYSTKALHALDKIRTKLLVIRVNAYLRLGEFCKTHAYVRSITETAIPEKLSVERPDIMENIRYCDAIEMFKSTGLNIEYGNHMAPGRYELALIGQIAMNKPEEYRHINGMKELPQEIRTIIFDQLDLIDILNCIHVSKDWRRYIYDSTASTPEYLKLDNKARKNSGSFSSEFYKSSIKLLSGDVEGLEIGLYPEEETKIEMFDLLANVPFHNLRVLSVIPFPFQFPDERLRYLLKNSHNSLEDLHIASDNITCNEILDMCPNLKLLRCLAFFPLPQSQQQPQHLSLEHLDTITNDIPQIGDFEEVLKRSPNLQAVHFDTQYHNMDHLRLINQYGSKKLRHIWIDRPGQFYGFYYRLSRYSISIDTSRFDYTIDVKNCNSMTAALLLQLVNHSPNMKQKIKAISLSLAQNSTFDDWEPFNYFTSPCLQYIRFSFTKETEGIFAAVIRNCPTLEEVIIFRLLRAPTNLTMNALKALPALRCFSIENVCYESYRSSIIRDTNYFARRCITDINDISIRQFFTHHVLLDNDSTLQEVRLRYIANLEPETFETLFKIKTLKSLNFAGHEILSNQQSFGSAITSTEGSLLPTELENLTLEGVQGISDYELQLLDCPTIVLLSLYGVAMSGFQGMMEKAQKLKELKLYYDEREHDDIIEGELKDTARRNNIQLKLKHDQPLIYL